MDPSQASTGLLWMSEDVLVHIVSFLEPPELLRLSEVCRTLRNITSLRITWTNACKFCIKGRGYPFPSSPLDDIPLDELTSATLHAWALSRRWRAGISRPRRIKHISATSGSLVSDVKFVPGRKGRLLVTLSKVVWSALTIWLLGEEVHGENGDREDGSSNEISAKVCEWSPRGAIFTGFAVNDDEKSPATFAISVHLNEVHSVKILKLSYDENAGYSLEELCSFDTLVRPVTLTGDLLALSDYVSQTAIWNWRNGTYALLEDANEQTSFVQSNECHQIVFAHQSVLVARARSIHLFPFPELKLPSPDGEPPTSYFPFASHSFGWVDGLSVTICPFLSRSSDIQAPSWQPLHILVRRESDDPWASDVHSLVLYSLDPNPHYIPTSSEGNDLKPPDIPLDDSVNSQSHSPLPSPYLFPPRLRYQVPCLRGPLRCKQIILGKFGTAVWIQPPDRFPAGLLADIPSYMIPTTDAHESVVMTVFPGSLRSSEDIKGEVGDGDERRVDNMISGKRIFGNELYSSWTSIDYDEVCGRIALGSSFGRVVILAL